MKRQYNKPLWLDTCVFKNLLGYDEGKTNKKGIKFEDIYNSKRLEKYIKHHGYLMSDYTLYEVLRDGKWNSRKIIDRLHYLNSRTKQRICSVRPDLGKCLFDTPEQSKVDQYMSLIFINIVDFASDYYARILLFPIVFNMYTFLYLFNQNKIEYNQRIVNDKLEKTSQFLYVEIKKEFFNYGKYTKSVAEKVINKFFLILNHISIQLYNVEMLNLSKKYESRNFNNAEDDIYKLLDVIQDKIEGFNYQEDIVRCDNTKYANATDTIMFSISNLVMKDYKCSREEWISIFTQTIDKILDSVYGLKDKNVIDIYFKNNIHDIYTKVLNESFRGNKVKENINGNDIIDLCGLSESVENNLIFISTDSGINRVIDVVYNDEQKEIVNLFIDFKFTKSIKK